jgi:hypothetical protein
MFLHRNGIPDHALRRVGGGLLGTLETRLSLTLPDRHPLVTTPPYGEIAYHVFQIYLGRNHMNGSDMVPMTSTTPGMFIVTIHVLQTRSLGRRKN